MGTPPPILMTWFLLPPEIATSHSLSTRSAHEICIWFANGFGLWTGMLESAISGYPFINFCSVATMVFIWSCRSLTLAASAQTSNVCLRGRHRRYTFKHHCNKRRNRWSTFVELNINWQNVLNVHLRLFWPVVLFVTPANVYSSTNFLATSAINSCADSISLTE